MARFEDLFERSARRIRARLASRIVLRYAGFGLFIAAVLAAASWWWHEPVARYWSAAAAVAGALLGVAVARRRRWSDGDVALFLDSRLVSKESISTAVELRQIPEVAPEVRSAVTRDAAAALERQRDRRAQPNLFERSHWIGIIGLLGLVGALAVPARARPRVSVPTGKELVHRNSVAGLDRVTRLGELEVADPERMKKLDEIAEEANKLQAALRDGIEKRDALARLAELEESIQGERLSLSDPESRAGLEAALGALGSDRALDRAARALGNGDVSAFDDEMKRLANLAERDARTSAKDLLEKAREAASRRGARDVAKMIEEQRRLFDEREDRAELLRELARSLQGTLADEAERALEEFSRTGDPEAQRKLTEALADAFGELTDEQRKQLAERLKDLGQNAPDLKPMTREQLRELARELSTEEGKQRLAESLKQLAEHGASDAARGDRALEDAERGTGEAQRDIGGLVPLPGSPDNGGAKSPGAMKQSGGAPGGSGEGGSHEAAGKTGAVEAETLKSKARVMVNPAIPLQGTTAGRLPARAGETANQRGVGSLTAAGPEQIQAVERSEIPAEYREQVGKYFEPR